MGFSDIFKGKQYKSELENLQKQHDDLQELLTPEMKDAFALQNKIRELEITISSKQQLINELSDVIDNKNLEISQLNHTVSEKKAQIIWMDDEILVQEFGLYKPQFEFSNSLDYKEKLADIRAKQKKMM